VRSRTQNAGPRVADSRGHTADFDDGRIGLGAGVRSAEGMICLSCFRLMRTLPQAIVSGSGALRCPLKSVAASVRRRKDVPPTVAPVLRGRPGAAKPRSRGLGGSPTGGCTR